MSSSPPDGLAVRAATDADAEACAALFHELEAVLGYRPAATASQVREWWWRVDLERDSWLLERDGRLEAVAWLELAGELAEGGGAVRPDAIGRGLGGWLLGRSEARAAELGLTLIRSYVYEADADGRSLLEHRGYRPVRAFHAMEMALHGPPEAASWPEGIRVEPFREGDARAMHDALEDAFAGTWGHPEISFEEWKRLRVDGCDTSLYFLARDGDEVAGVIRCQPEHRGMGWVGALGVRKRWQRRGLGRALLLHALGAFYARGETRVGLGVDTENPNDASRLYESVGMTVQAADVVYEKELA
jgi:GNAT superfamily N-acetyltransferase